VFLLTKRLKTIDVYKVFLLSQIYSFIYDSIPKVALVSLSLELYNQVWHCSKSLEYHQEELLLLKAPFLIPTTIPSPPNSTFSLNIQIFEIPLLLTRLTCGSTIFGINL